MKKKSNKTLLQLANAAFQIRDYNGAIVLYERVIKESPTLSFMAEQNIIICKAEIDKEKLFSPEQLTAKEKIKAKVKTIESATELTKKEQIAAPELRSKLEQGAYATIFCDDLGNVKKDLKCAIIINAAIFNLAFVERSLTLAKSAGLEKGIFLLLSDEDKYRLDELWFLLDGVTVISGAIKNSPLLTLVNVAEEILKYDFDAVCLSQLLNYHESRGLTEQQISLFSINQAEQLFGSEQNILKIISAFETSPALGVVGCADAYKNSSTNPVQSSSTYTQFTKAISLDVDPAKKFGYFSGLNVWLRPEILKMLSSAITHLESNKGEGFYPDIELGVELLASIASAKLGFEDALVYANSKKNVDVEIIFSKNTLIPTGSHYTLGHSFQAYTNLEDDAERLIKANIFSENFYSQNYSYLSGLRMKSIYHFLRFGAQEGFNPNENFSVDWYRETNKYEIKEFCYNPVIHYISHSAEGLIVFPAQENLPKIMELIGTVSLFDEKFYLDNYPDVAKSRMRPLFHYCKYGWQELRIPCSPVSFDAVWYESEYLTGYDISINPLLHYALSSEKKSLKPHAVLDKLKKGYRHPKKDKVKRICLFAGYDAHGIVDDYVIELITELSLYSDVYYLADTVLAEQELVKLKGITKQAWAFRHGEYDFGSYARLALNLVGWEKLQKYDEVLLVNDSSYLLKSLDTVFRKMDGKPCDWWGLQATKGISATRFTESNQFTSKIPMTKVLESVLPSYERDDCYDFHIGSYFLAFRKPTLSVGGVFHALLKSVKKEKNKRNIVLRYEIGLTHNMLLAGHKPATFIDHLYPFHPIFTENHFKLISEGFPLFKRYLLTENHYKVPGLWNWKEKIQKILPSVNLEFAERNLWRVGSAEKLYATLNIPEDGTDWPRPLLSNVDFIKEDLAFEKDDRCWAFPVCAFDHLFGGNERMVFESVKNDPSIKKVILSRSKKIDIDGVNLHIVPLKSREGQELLIEAKYIFIKHTAWRNTLYPLNPDLHRFINLWHGIPLKRIGYTSLDLMNNLQANAIEHDKFHAVIASSKIDRLAMAAAFYPLTFHDVWLTGLPRNDVILRAEELLPNDFKHQLEKLREELSGRKLVFYAPTFRNAQGGSSYKFSDDEISKIADCMLKHNAVLGVREHMAAKNHSYFKALSASAIPMLNLGREHYADIELIYREADVLITDYSSCFIDFMLTGKPEICFAYDYEQYAGSERGLFYELKDVFPGPVCDNAISLVSHIDESLSGIVIESKNIYEMKRRNFFEYIDDNNSSRLIETIFNETMDQAPSRSTRNRLEIDA